MKVVSEQGLAKKKFSEEGKPGERIQAQDGG